MDSSTNVKKLARFEEFLHARLHPDLKAVDGRRAHLIQQHQDYLDLKRNLRTIKTLGADLSSLRSRIDIGSGVKVQASISSCELVLIKTYLGFYIECDLDEADRVIDLHTTHLEGKIKQAGEQVAELRANIQIVLQGMQELT